MDYSLAHKCVTVGKESCFLYTIHDIILDYLKGSISKQRQRELQELVVERYRNKCEGAFSELENDGYVFKHLIGHIIASENFELLGDLMSQLNWLISNVVYGDANLLLSQYRDYKCKVPQTLEVDVRKFELFLSSHMYVLTNDPKKDDIVQFALLQPDDSELYTQAKFIVQKEKKKKSWFKWDNKESDPEKYVLKLKVHEEGVTSCQFTKDGDRVLSSGGTEVKLWDASTGMVYGEFKGHTDRVTCCVLGTNGRLLVTSSEDNSVKVWETRTQRLVCDFREHKYGVQCCSLSPDNKWVLSADIDSVIILWDVLLGKDKILKKWRVAPQTPLTAQTPTNEVTEPPDFLSPGLATQDSSGGGGGEGVLSCAFSPDGTQFVTTSQNGMIRLWDSNSACVNMTFQGHSLQVMSCVFSKTGTQLASASYDCTAKVWDTSSGECTATLTHGEEVAVFSCDFSQDSSRLITGDSSGSVKIWSLPHGIMLQDMPLHWDYVTCVLYSPKTQNILSAADNGIAKILWSEEIDEEEVSTAPVQYHRRFAATFLKEDSTYEPLVLCYVQKENKMQLVKGSRADVVNPCLPTVPGANPRSCTFSNSGDKIAIGYVQSKLQLLKIDRTSSWSVSEVWAASEAHRKEILKCYFSPDDTKLASCCNKEHKIWNVATGSLISSMSGRGIGVKPCIFLDNKRVLSIQETSLVLLWDSNTGSVISKFECGSGKDDTILCINVSKDNRRLVASTTIGLVLVWNITGELLMKSDLMPLPSCARSCALSPDGSLAVSGFDDGSLKIWNVATKRAIGHQYTGSQYWMIDVAFSLDGCKIVSLCDSIDWWTADGTHLKRVLLKGTFGKYIRFSPNFHTFVTIDNAGLLYVLTSLT